MLIKEFLKQRIEGMKNERGVCITPAFPKLLYVLDENNITPDSEYWDLTVLAAECTAKRMVPDYISAKKMREYKNGDIYGCMGKQNVTAHVKPFEPRQWVSYLIRLTVRSFMEETVESLF